MKSQRFFQATTIAPVRSVEASFTITQRSGLTVCLRIEAIVFSRNLSSLCAGVMTTYADIQLMTKTLFLSFLDSNATKHARRSRSGLLIWPRYTDNSLFDSLTNTYTSSL